MTKHDLSRLTMGAAEQPTTEELKARILRQHADEAEKNSRKNREFIFDFRYEAPDGTRYEGRFKNRILSVQQRCLAGALTSELLGGKPIDSVPNKLVQLAVAIGWMEFSLDKKRPDWAQNLGAIEDEHVIFALYTEVWSHQETFLGRAHDAQPAPQEE